MLVKALYKMQGQDMQVQKGDLLSLFEDFVTVTGTGNVTYVGSNFATTLLDHTGATSGATADTLPTAADICASVQGQIDLDGGASTTAPFQGTGTNAAVYQWKGLNNNSVDPKSSWRIVIRNSTTGGNAIVMAVAASSGVTLTGSGSIASASWAEYLVRIDNASPLIVGPATTTNTSATLTNMSAGDLSQITPGMSVYGTGIPASTTVLASSMTAGTVTLSNAATATGNNVQITFTPTVAIIRIKAGTN